MSRISALTDDLITFSRAVDDGQPDGPGLDLARIAKVAEQAGEAIGDYLRSQGRNVVKDDYTVNDDDVAKRVLSVAFSALAVYEHLTDHAGRSFEDLEEFATEMVAKVE